MRRAFTFALLLALPGLAACGDKGPSKQEFLAKADPVCKRGNDIAAVLTTPSDIGMMKDFGNKLADNISKTTVELGKLKLPHGKDGDAAKGWITAMKDAAASSRAVGVEVDKTNYPGIEAAADKLVNGFKAADAKARAYGSTECGRGEADAAAKLGETKGATVKAAYVLKVDAICAAATKEFDAVKEPENFADVKPFLEKSIALAEKETADIKAVPAPATDKAKLDEAFTANEAALAKAKEALAAAAAGDQRKTLNLLDEVSTLGDTSNAKADAYGFKDCGSQGG